MSFGIQIFDMDLLQWLNIDYDSGNYPIDQNRSVDLSTITGLAEGTFIRPQARVVWGNTATPSDHVLYTKNGQTATWAATGTTLDVHIARIGG